MYRPCKRKSGPRALNDQAYENIKIALGKIDRDNPEYSIISLVENSASRDQSRKLIKWYKEYVDRPD